MINRRSLMIAAGVAVAGRSLQSSAVQAADPIIKIGVIQPQQGDCAQWGIPITRGVQLWADEVSQGGGLVAGDGKQYKIQTIGYDNVCYTAGDELKAARRAILDDGVHFLLQTYTPSCRQAIGPLTNESRTFVTSYGGGFLSSKFPYLLGGQTGQPMGNMLTISHIIEKHPEAKRIAIITGDTSFAKAARAYIQAGVASHGDKVQIVYDASYSASATSDMLGLLSPVAAAKPDIVYEMGFTPGPKATMVATLEQLGFKGIYGSESWEINFIKEAGVLDAVAGRLFSGPAIDAEEPTFSPRAHDFYKRYVSKFGAAEWISYASAAYGAAVAFEIAFKASPSIEPEVVMKSLYAMSSINHPLYGECRWGGKDIFGADHHLYTPQPVYGVNKDGSPNLSGVVETSDWWAKNKAVALPKLKAGGQVYAT